MRRVNDEQLEVLAREALESLPEEARCYGAGEVYSIIHNQGIIASPDRVQIAVNAILEEEEDDER